MAKTPDKVGKYKILDQIGKGGMGVVYSAMHPTLKRKVILKKLTIRDKEFRERFRLEADLMMDLRSDYIVDMYDHFREGSSWYIAMEYIEGITLEDLIARDELSDLQVILYIALCAARALEYIHSRGIVHRDIKPSNIYISKRGDVKLGDFGIASSSGRSVRITDSGAAMGTPAYMAPEQFDDSSTVGWKADLFSFGVTLYESLTGAKPFQADSYTALKKEIRRGRFKNPSLYRKNMPLYLKWMIRRCLFVAPRLRPSGISSFRKRLERELGRRSLPLIREQLAAAVEGKKRKGKSPALTQTVEPDSGKSKKYIAVLAALSAMLVLAGFFGWSLFSRSYGIVQMAVLPDGDGSVFTLYPHSSEKLRTGSFNGKGEKRLFLPVGSYRIVIESGASQSWRSFYVAPLRESREPINMTVLSTPLEKLPLYLDITVRDRYTGIDLTDVTDVYMERDGQWTALSGSEMKSMVTGSLYKLKFSSNGYVDEVYSASVDNHQTSLDLQVLISPVPALVAIGISDVEDILINGRNEYFSPETLRFVKLNNRSGETTEITLLPGVYTFKYEGSEEVIEKNLDLKSGGKYNFP